MYILQSSQQFKAAFITAAKNLIPEFWVCLLSDCLISCKEIWEWAAVGIDELIQAIKGDIKVVEE